MQLAIIIYFIQLIMQIIIVGFKVIKSFTFFLFIKRQVIQRILGLNGSLFLFSLHTNNILVAS